jgi:hypothetical protein
MADTRFTSPAADRNKQPILEVLRAVLGERGRALEIASGTGQHLVWFAAAMPTWTWQPSEADARMLPGIAERIALSGLGNVLPPVLLDVTSLQWALQDIASMQGFDAIYCANMLHIAPWSACVGLMDLAGRRLAPSGVLVTYGPYFEDAQPAPSNLAFDEDLRARDPSWGIRRLDDVAAAARMAGLTLRARHEMPANNLLLVFGR